MTGAIDQPKDPSRRRLLRGAAVVGVVSAAGLGTAVFEEAVHAGGRRAFANEHVRRLQPDAVIRVDTEAPMIAVTFDDGPDPAYTPHVLDILALHQMHATFFVVGVNAEAFPDLVRRTVAEGHQVANHTYDHPHLERLGIPTVEQELRWAQEVITAVGAPPPTLFRPPRGYTDDAVARGTRALNLRTVYWSEALDPYLHRSRAPQAAADNIVGHLGPGSVLLAHDSGHIHAPRRTIHDRSGTVAALPQLLRGLTERGVRSVTVATLLAQGATRVR